MQIKERKSACQYWFFVFMLFAVSSGAVISNNCVVCSFVASNVGYDEFVGLLDDERRMKSEYRMVSSDTAIWNKLLNMIEKNDNQAVFVGLHFLPYSQGGNQGDLYRALSVSFSKNAESYLRNILQVNGVGKFKTNEYVCESLFATLSFDYVDKWEKKVTEYESRRNVLASHAEILKDIGCSSVLIVLDEEISAIKEILKEREVKRKTGSVR